MPGAVTAGSFVINMSANVAGLKTDLADATNSVKTSSQNIVNAWAGVTAETDRASYAGMKLVAGLKDEIATFGMTSQQLTQYRANLAGVGTETQALIARLQSMQGASTAFGEEARKAGGHVDGFSFSTAGAKRELLVLAHELSQGNYSKFSGSMMVLAEQTGAASLLFSAAGLTALGMGAAFVVAAVDIYKMSSAIEDFNKNQLLTNNYAGQTRDSIASMAAGMQSSATGGISKATEMLAGLAATGKFTGGELAAVGETALKFSEITGQSSDEVIKKFEGMTSGVANFAEEANKSYHFLTAAQYEEIVVLEKQGKSQLAVMETMRLLNESLGEQKQSVLQMINPWTGWGMIIDAVNSSLRQTIFPTIGEQAKKVAADLMSMQREAKAASESWGAGPAIKADWDAKIAEQKHKLHDLIAQSNREEIAAGNKQHLDMSNLAGVAARKEMDQLTQSLRSKAAIRADEAKKIQHDADVLNQNAIDNGGKQVYTQEQINKLIAASNEKNKDEVVKGSDDRARILEGALLVQKTAFDRETSIYGERDKMLALYHSKFGLSDTDFYAGREAARAEYIDSEASAFVKEAALINGFKPRNAEEIAANKNKYDTLLRQHLEFTDKMRQASVDDAANALADEKKKFDDITKAVGTAGDAELKRLDESIAKQREHNAEIGKTKEQIELAKKAQEEAGTASLEIEAEEIDALLKDSSLQGILQGQYREIYAERLAYLDRIIAKRKEESSLFDVGASLAAEADIAKKAEKAWESANKSIGDGLYSAIANGGDSAIKKLLKDSKEWFARLILSPVIQPIAAFGASLINPGAANAQGTVGGALGEGNMLSAGKSLWDGFSAGAGSLGTGFMGSVAGGLNGAGIGSGLTSSMGLEIGNSIASIVGPEVAGTLASTMSVFAAAAPWAAAALAAYSVISNLTEGETRGGGQYGYAFDGQALNNNRRGTVVANATAGVNLLEGPSGGEVAGDAVRAAITGTVTGINTMLKQLGSSAALTGFQAGIETSDKGRGGVFAGGTLSTGSAFGLSGAGSNYDGTLYDKAFNTSPDAKSALTDFSTELKQTTIQALQAATDIPKSIADQLTGVDAKKLTDDTATALLTSISTEITAVNNFRDAVNALPFDSLKNLSFDAADSLIRLSGGVDKLSSNLSNYFQNFYSEQERVDLSTKSLTKNFADLGFAMPANNAALRAQIEAQDRNTEAGRKAYVQLLGLSGAFASLSTATDQLTAAAASERKGLQDQLDQLTMTSAQLLDKQRNALDASNRALFDQVQSVTAQQAAVTNAKSVLTTAYQNESKALQDTIAKFKDFSASTKAFRDSLYTGNLSPLSGKDQLSQAQSQFAITNASAKAGNATAMAALQGVSQTYLTALQAQSATSQDYARAFAQVQNALGDNVKIADAQATTAEKQLAALDQSVSGLITINTSVLSVADAIKALQAAMSAPAAAAAAGGGGAAGAGVKMPDGNADLVNSDAYKAVAAYGKLYTSPAKGDAYYFVPGVNDYASKVQAATDTSAITGKAFDWAQVTGHSQAYWSDMQAQYDAGLHPTTKTLALDGSHANGLDSVPFDGYRAELHKGEMVLPARVAQSVRGGGGDNSELVAEIRLLRAENREMAKRLDDALYTIAKHAMNMADTIDTWEGAGMPVVRSA